MKRKSIIMSAWSIRKIKAGIKTQTRRLIMPQPLLIDDRMRKWPQINTNPAQISKASRIIQFSPHQVGDILRIKETWRVANWREDREIKIQYRADGEVSDWIKCPSDEMFERLWTESSNEFSAAGIKIDRRGHFIFDSSEAPTRWRSPLFMPQWASRLNIEITGIKAERVQEISEEDALAEGLEKDGKLWRIQSSEADSPDEKVYWTRHDLAFREIWDSLHAKPKAIRSNSRWAKWLGWNIGFF